MAAMSEPRVPFPQRADSPAWVLLAHFAGLSGENVDEPKPRCGLIRRWLISPHVLSRR